MLPANANLRGILAMTASCAMLIVGDTLLKIISATFPVGQIIFMRGALVFALITAGLAATGQLAAFRAFRNPRIWVRTSADLLGTVTYMPALFNLPIANATVLLQMSPLALTLSAALYLREPVGLHRWAAIAIGFIGVVIVLRPGVEGFNIYALFVFATIAGVCVRDISTRLLPGGINGFVLVAATALGGVGIGLVMKSFEAWVWPGWTDLPLIAGTALAMIAGYFLVIIAVRTGDVSLVSTFRYSIVPYAIIAGYIVWGDLPDGAMLLGTAIVLGAGLYLVHRERLRSRTARRAREAEA